jgi:serine/threonine protein kinase
VPDHRDSEPAAGNQPGGSGWVLGGRYRVLSRIGRGGMAEVFRAHDDLLDRDVAVKVFRALDGLDPDSSTNGAVRRDLELRALAQLNHPNLITLYDGSLSGDGPAFLVLELVHGSDLAARLADGPLPEPEVRVIGAQLADALAYVHAHGLVHRDVKPANILLGTDEAAPGEVRARLSDFGIVRLVDGPRMTSADLTVGTAYYIAPEQARGSTVGPPADVYALGLVLLEALTGRRSFDGPMHEALAARLTTRPAIPSGLPAPWPELLAAMTDLDLSRRPEAAEVARQLRGGGADPLLLPGTATAATAAVPASESRVAALAAPASLGSVTSPTYAAPAQRQPPRSHLGMLWSAVGAVLAALALGGFLLVHNTGSHTPTTTEPTGTATSPTAPATTRHTTRAAHPGTAPRTAGATHSTPAHKHSTTHSKRPKPPARSTSSPATHSRSTSPSAQPSGPSTSPSTPSSSAGTSSAAADGSADSSSPAAP